MMDTQMLHGDDAINVAVHVGVAVKMLLDAKLWRLHGAYWQVCAHLVGESCGRWCQGKIDA